jgi:DNA-binding NarL/FixJ family response regulator
MAKATKLKILLVDDHRLFRDGLRTLLTEQQDIDVIGETVDGLSAIKFVEERKPDIVLMDISMPGLNGIETTRKILAINKSVRIVILSMHSDQRFVIESLKAGATGYLLKDCAFEELLEAIHSTAQNQIYLSRKIAAIVVKDYLCLSQNMTDSVFSILSGREREVLQMLAEGQTTKETAAKLQVSVKTIESHRKQIMYKLNIHSIAELTKYAIREGLTQL